MIHRIRKRDLFPFAGETIITPKQISELLGSDKNHLEDSIKRQLLTIIRQYQQNQNDGKDDGVIVEDIFCQIVQIGYGKGNLNPVSHLTTFYAPNKEFRGLDFQQNQQEWRVGVIPEGKSSNLMGNMRFSFDLSYCIASISRLVPKEFEEVYIRVYGRNKSKLSLVRSAFLEVSNYLYHIFKVLKVSFH